MVKNQPKTRVYHFYPFAKDRREKINELQAITFDEESASDTQNILAPPKCMILVKQLTPIFFGAKIVQILFSVEKWKIANRMRRVLPKFRTDPTSLRGVNGRSKFRKKINAEPSRAGRGPAELEMSEVPAELEMS